MTSNLKFSLSSLLPIVLVFLSSCAISEGAAPQEPRQIYKQDWGAQSSAASLCKPKEDVYFTCSTGGQKLISICEYSDGDLTPILSYRFGVKDNVELEYSANRGYGYGAGDGFLKNSYHRAFVEYTEVAFQRNGYEYRVFKRTDDSPAESGVANTPVRDFGVEVSRAQSGEALATIMCDEVGVDNLRGLSLLLDCDRSSALGCIE